MKDFDFEEFIREEAEREGKEIKKYVIDGVTHYTLGKPDIDRLARVALSLVK